MTAEALPRDQLTQSVRGLAKAMADGSQSLSESFRDCPATFRSNELFEIYIQLSKAIQSLQTVQRRLEGIQDVDCMDAIEADWTIEKWETFLAN